MLLVVLSRRALNRIISLVVLLAVAVLVTGVSIPRTPRTSLTAGVVSGITATTSAIGGPPLALLFHCERALLRSSAERLIRAIGAPRPSLPSLSKKGPRPA